jgi:hypothetical protein
LDSLDFPGGALAFEAFLVVLRRWNRIVLVSDEFILDDKISKKRETLTFA